jgi:hypothetical protein
MPPSPTFVLLPFQLRSTFPGGTQGLQLGQEALLPALGHTDPTCLSAHLCGMRGQARTACSTSKEVLDLAPCRKLVRGWQQR